MPRDEMPTEAQVETGVGVLTLLADATRLRMLFLLGNSEHDVGTLAEAAGTTPAAASQHLAKLRLGFAAVDVDPRKSRG